MVWVEDELVFTEMNTLMTVAREAADKVIEATTRIAREAREEMLETLDTHGRESPSRVIPVALLEDSVRGIYTMDDCNQIGEDKGRPNRRGRENGLMTHQHLMCHRHPPTQLQKYGGRGWTMTNSRNHQNPRQIHQTKMTPKTPDTPKDKERGHC